MYRSARTPIFLFASLHCLQRSKRKKTKPLTFIIHKTYLLPFYPNCNTKCTSPCKAQSMTKTEVLQRKSCLLTGSLEHPTSLNQTVFTDHIQPFCRHPSAKRSPSEVCLGTTRTAHALLSPTPLTFHSTLTTNLSCTGTLGYTHTQRALINPALVFVITYPRQQLLHPSLPSMTEHMCSKTIAFPNLTRVCRSWYTTPKLLLYFLTRLHWSPDSDLLGGLLHCITGRTRQFLGPPQIF